jgi:hypothetical protein
VAGCCECGDEPSGSCATELVRCFRVLFGTSQISQIRGKVLWAGSVLTHNGIITQPMNTEKYTADKTLQKTLHERAGGWPRSSPKTGMSVCLADRRKATEDIWKVTVHTGQLCAV